MSGTYDFDLHGVVGVRLLDAREADAAMVARQLGLPVTQLDRRPDVTVRFTDVVTHEPLTYVGVGEAGFNRDGFFVLGPRGGRPLRTRVPFEAAGRSPELVCERGLPSVPHLLALVNLAALRRAVLPLHASAFVLDSSGVLVMGWSKGGKTETLLAAMERGAQYVGDEWVYLTEDDTMLGLPEPIRIWDWHLQQLPQLRRDRTRGDLTRVSAWRAVSDLARTAAASRIAGADLARRVDPLARRQANLRIPPAELFGADRITLRARADAIVLVLSHAREEIVAQVAEQGEVSGRMAASLAEERAPFMSHYRQFRYAFPHLHNPFVEAAGQRETRLLAERLDHRRCAKVLHPHPCDIAALGEAVLAAAHGLGAPGTAVPASAPPSVRDAS